MGYCEKLIGKLGVGEFVARQKKLIDDDKSECAV